jgi:hypothetical protein
MRLFLCHVKEGMKRAEIAARMSTDVESVRRSLVRTYAELRIKMMGWDDDDGAPVPHTPHKTRSWMELSRDRRRLQAKLRVCLETADIPARWLGMRGSFFRG